MNHPMNPSLQQLSSENPSRYNREHDSHPHSTVSWGAIFAGAMAALALQVLFMMLGAGLGLAIYNPLTGQNPVTSLSMGALIIHSIFAIISLCLGGWVAGRFSPVCARATGWLHGFSVWCAATVGGVIFVAMGIGWMLAGLAAIGQTAASVAGDVVDLAADAVEVSGETISSFVDEAMSDVSEDGRAGAEIRAKREVGMALARLFNPIQDGDNAANRTAAVNALADHTEMNQAEAERTIAEWTATYNRMQDDLTAMTEAAEREAREAADAVASAIARISLWGFLGFLLGALAATWGGHLGALSATRCEETIAGPLPAHERIDPDKRQVPAAKT